MVTFLCKGCGYKFSPKNPKRTNPMNSCPACSRKGTLVETSGLLNQFLNDADNNNI